MGQVTLVIRNLVYEASFVEGLLNGLSTHLAVLIHIQGTHKQILLFTSLFKVMANVELFIFSSAYHICLKSA